MRIDVITALPELLVGPLDHSIVGRARKSGIVEIRVHDLRDYTEDRHRQVDDYPYGGGAGMVLKPEPIFACVRDIQRDASERGAPIDEVVYLTPDGERFSQGMANSMSMANHVVLLAGHYKGVDQRVRDELITKEISIGDYVLSGGELPAIVLVDAMVRLLPGAIGDSTSALSDSFQDELLDAPSYTRPAVFEGMEVPPVLRSGDHEAVREWREAERLKKTRDRRPDLLDQQD